MRTNHRLTRFVAVLTILLVGLTGSAIAADSGPYDVKLEQVDAHAFPRVTLFVTIADPANGEIVGGLTQDQFTVTEDGKPVEIVEFSAGNLGPISTVLTIDHSGSMEVEGKMTGAKEAATAFVDLMRPQDKAALIVFDDTVSILQEFTTDQALLRQSIDAVTIGGCTAWYDGVWDTVDLMASVAGRRNAILLSDGIDCSEGGLLQKVFGGDGSQHSLDEAIQHAREADVAIHTIGLGAQATSEVSDQGFDEEKLKRMATETGGTYHYTPTADQLRTLYESFAETTQKEYVITVKSGRASYDGTRRNIQVTVGGSQGGGAYVEQHLLNVQSSPWVALAFVVPMGLAIVIPLAWRKARRPARQSSTPTPTPPPAWNTNQPVPLQGPYPAPRQPGSTPQPPVGPPLSMPAVSVAPGQTRPPAPGTACPNCKQPVRPGAHFCTQCGTTLPPAAPAAGPALAVCSRCGRPLRSNVQFCSNCGQRSRT